MRQVLLVIVLVAAAFAGGAVVRGPGPRWIQAQLFDYMGLKDGGEVASIDLPAVSPSAPGHDAAQPPSGNAGLTPDPIKKKTEPAPSGAIQPGRDSKTSDASLRKASSGGFNGQERKPAGQTAGIPSPAPAKSGPTASAGDHSVSKPAASTSSSRSRGPGSSQPDKAPLQLDPSIGSALLAELTAGAASTKEPDPVSSIPLEAAPRSAPSAPVSQTPPLVPPVSRDKEDSSATTEVAQWSSLRHKMQVLGVTEYTITGNPNSRARIVCLIPFAGRQGIAQRFEAEGSNEFEATRSAIRKITLWQVSRDRAP